MHVLFTDGNQALAFGSITPSERGERLRVGDDGRVVTHGPAREADVNAFGEVQTVGEADGSLDDSMHGDCQGRDLLVLFWGVGWDGDGTYPPGWG